MRQPLKDLLESLPSQVACSEVYRLGFGYSCDRGDYDEAMKWLVRNGYFYDVFNDTWLSPDVRSRSVVSA